MNQEPVQQYRFSVVGVSCASCVNPIEKTLRSKPGIKEASLNFATKELLIRCIASVSESTITDTLKEMGYTARLIKDNDKQSANPDMESHHFQKLRKQTIFAGLVGVPLFITGMMNSLPGLTTPFGYWLNIFISLLSFIVLFYSGKHFFVGALKAFKAHLANMDTLIAIGTGAAWFYSTIVLIFIDAIPAMAQHVYFEASVVIIALVNLGALLELRARRNTSQAIEKLMHLQPKTARLFKDNVETDVPIEEIVAGSTIRVRPGEQIPVDGLIIEGSSMIDESMLTGEPIAPRKEVGDKVFAGTLNKNSSFIYQASHIGKDSVLGKIIQLIEAAQSTKPSIAKLADQIASVFVPVVILIAIFTGLIWFNIGPEPISAYMLVTTMTVLIIACPCALGLAVPISVMVGIGKGAEFGVLIRHAEALQQAGKLTTVLLDKTGTITLGHPEVTGLYPKDGVSPDKMLGLAASLEQGSEHPLAEAILNKAKKEKIILTTAKDFETVSGLGVSGTINDRHIKVGNSDFMQQHEIELNTWKDKASKLAESGETPLFIAQDNELLGILTIADPIKPDSDEAIRQLQSLGINVIMLTGDHKITAEAIANRVGIQTVFANILPQDKAKKIADEQARGEVVGMVGDGINDAAALSLADVGFAMGAGSDIAMESADITLMRNSLISVVDAIAISKATYKNMKQNLWGAFIYNAFGIPIAAGVLYPFINMLLDPMIAGLAMALSSVTVISNANRLRLFQPRGKKS